MNVGGRKMARRFVLLVVMAGAVLLVCSAVAFAAVRTGTGGNDRLAGTRDNDRITGRGGDDTTIGKAGNDTYYYANGWGQDAVIDSRGTDTLNFSAVTENVDAFACPELGGTGGQVDSASGGVALGSRIEGLRGGMGNDRLNGCGGKNTYAGGASQPLGTGTIPADLLLDYDGMPAIGLPASDDVYLPSREGQVVVADGGGAADVLNLAGFHSTEVEILSEDLDNDGTEGSVVVLYGSGDMLQVQMLLANQFEDDEFSDAFSIALDFDGRIEQIKLKDTVFNVTPESVQPASARRSTDIQGLSVDLSRGALLP
ncbi:MAG: hypothetical protein M3N33_01075 [Actinomycetota bacterium]|nr:hypothetical protein [Actinomycetota bacterium]